MFVCGRAYLINVHEGEGAMRRFYHRHHPTTITTTAPTTITQPTTTTAKICTFSGQTWADPTNCHKYYSCDANLKPQSQTCGLGLFQYYDATKGQCVGGFC